MRRLLKLPGLPGTDAADALGLAITHAHAAKSIALLAQAKGLGGMQIQTQKAAYKAGRSR